MEAIILSKSDFETIRDSLLEMKDHMKNITSPEERFIGTEDFVKLMGVSHRTAQVWRNDGKIGFSQMGKKIYYRMSDIELFLKKHYQPPAIEE